MRRVQIAPGVTATFGYEADIRDGSSFKEGQTVHMYDGTPDEPIYKGSATVVSIIGNKMVIQLNDKHLRPNEGLIICDRRIDLVPFKPRR